MARIGKSAESGSEIRTKNTGNSGKNQHLNPNEKYINKNSRIQVSISIPHTPFDTYIKNSLFPVADHEEYSILTVFFKPTAPGAPPYLSEISTFEKKSIHGRLPPPAG